MAIKTRKLLAQLWQVGVSSVSGRAAVEAALIEFANANEGAAFQPDLILSIGKAASGMCLGALNTTEANCPAIVVTKVHHVDDDLKQHQHVRIIESAHPVPDQNSLIAGQVLLGAVSQLKKKEKLLLLVSGGASALAECLPDSMSLEDLQQATSQMLASGKTIAEINAHRKQMSSLKDGKLLQNFIGAQVQVFAISDVEGDSISVIGSGIGDTHRVNEAASHQIIASNKIIASNQIARDCIVKQVQENHSTLEVRLNQESLYDDVFKLAPQIANQLKQGEPGIYIWGGEPTIQLPDNPGSGGRNQSLALALAKEIVGCDNITVLVAGTDGTDGPTDAAGGYADGSTFSNTAAAQKALAAANAGSYLRDIGDIYISGPTNTNVMDLIIAIVESV